MAGVELSHDALSRHMRVAHRCLGGAEQPLLLPPHRRRLSTEGSSTGSALSILMAGIESCRQALSQCKEVLLCCLGSAAKRNSQRSEGPASPRGGGVSVCAGE